MTSVAKIIDRAFQKIGVRAEDETLTAYQMQSGLDALQEMLSAWTLQGVALPFYEMRIEDNFQLDRRFHEGVIHMLAARLSVEYQAPAGFDPDAFMRQVQAAFMSPPQASLTDLQNTASQMFDRGYEI